MREEEEAAANRAVSKLQVRSSPLTRGELTPSSLPPSLPPTLLHSHLWKSSARPSAVGGWTSLALPRLECCAAERASVVGAPLFSLVK